MAGSPHRRHAASVIGGAVQGSTLLSETMSQYSALMVMEKEYGREKMRKFLKYDVLNLKLTGKTPDEIATAISWLASAEASNVNGLVMPSDGGWTAA